MKGKWAFVVIAGLFAGCASTSPPEVIPGTGMTDQANAAIVREADDCFVFAIDEVRPVLRKSGAADFRQFFVNPGRRTLAVEFYSKLPGRTTWRTKPMSFVVTLEAHHTYVLKSNRSPFIAAGPIGAGKVDPELIDEASQQSVGRAGMR